jgi:hypothetical protein
MRTLTLVRIDNLLLAGPRQLLKDLSYLMSWKKKPTARDRFDLQDQREG